MIGAIKQKISPKQKRSLKRPYFLFDLLRNGLADTWLYIKHSNTLFNYQQQSKLEAQLFKQCHRIEKGMSLSDIRMGFGEDAFKTILQHLRDLELLNVESDARLYAGAVVREYLGAHQGFTLQPKMIVLLGSIESLASQVGDGVGTFELTREDVMLGGKGSFEQMVSTRHSVRQYSEVPIEDTLLEDATRLASRTPSVCNRQAFKVRFYTNKQKVDELLKHQNGNLAFRKEIPAVAVVSVDLRYFDGVGERNQAYIDGGLFAMSLVYGLHHVGLGSCFLNWSVRRQQDKAFRKVSMIPENEVIITLMSVGNLKNEFSVAASPNKKFSSLCSIIADK